ncbi:MAG: phosphoenolpyruvate--protein phosphotransferase [Pseudomonadota bacterium]
MPANRGGSRALLRALRATMAETGDGQLRLDKVVRLVASNMVAEVCSVYLKRDADTLELCATEGLRQTSVHSARLRVGQGLVGRIAQRAEPLATDDAENTPGFRYLPETGEELYKSFVGVPIQRMGEIMGVLVVQNTAARQYEEDDVEALEVVAMVIAEMAESGAFTGSADVIAGRTGPLRLDARGAAEGMAEGVAHLHEPRLVTFDPIAEDPVTERRRLMDAMKAVRGDADRLLEEVEGGRTDAHRDILEAYRMVAYDKGWVKRLIEAIDSGLAAEVAVEKVQSVVRSRMERVQDPYLRERLHDLDDLANRLLRHLVSPGTALDDIPDNAVLIARNLGPGELMDHAQKIRAIVLEEGSLSSHATIVARALGVPMVVQADRATRDTNPGDTVVVDGDLGRAYVRPDAQVLDHLRGRIALAAEARQAYNELVDKAARTRDGVEISLKMNAGVLADLPSLKVSGAAGVGLFRTELQFLVRQHLPRRDAQAALYGRVLDAADGAEVIFRTLDIGSDKVLPYMRRLHETNPALGWRAIRVGLDRPRLFRMQLQALIRAAAGRDLSLMFPMVTVAQEFHTARQMVDEELVRMTKLGYPAPNQVKVGLMFEVPALLYAPDSLYEAADFMSVGGNDLFQFFTAADRENERVRGRYDVLDLPFLAFLEQIVTRCAKHDLRLSFCGEAAGQPVEALVLSAIGFRELSMRPSSIGPVKQSLRRVDLAEIRSAIDAAREVGAASARDSVQSILQVRGFKP